MNGSEARSLFIEYFEKHNHRHVRSSSLVPSDDPTLLFTNAGMVQFKRTFIGEEKRDYTTAVTSQKCVRAGGKHNDLENVGYTARHHTFFEMLGNFSFGDYFKEQAIAFAWDLLTNGYKLPVEKLWISIYKDDDEAFKIWHEQIGVPKERIVRLGEKDNFWSMGDTGPCGPCTEIHIDRGEKFGCDNPECAVGCDCDRYLEIWNLVFMQFERSEDGTLTPLPKPSIDTGMGLERIVSVIQGADTNYETDLFVPIINKVEELSGKSIKDSSQVEVAMKVIADHSRAASFLIGDGILPSNEGRGYVLRRIIRRAIRYGRNIGLTEPFLHNTAEVVFDVMKEAYPEFSDNRSFITKVIKNEEESFSITLDNGLRLLNDALEELKNGDKDALSGKIIFKLYDTFGFPVDIIKDVTKGMNVKLDIDGFNVLMEKQREQSKTKVSFKGSAEVFKSLSTKGVVTEFTGYTKLEDNSEILVLASEGVKTEKVINGDDFQFVTAKTPFYAESGGQAGDKGIIETENGKAIVTDTVKDPTGLFIHSAKVIEGSISADDKVRLVVDEQKRKQTACNHTVTHILQAALRTIVGDHVKQAGSLVNHERLRFDFSHFSPIDTETLNEIEDFVNEKIRLNVTTETNEMDAEEAFKTGATALFEEKYGDRVRVVSLGKFSKEFCGGTHTGATGNIGFFKIISDTGIAAGVRRIEAVTGNAALQYVQSAYKTVNETANLLKSNPEGISKRIEKLISENKKLEKELAVLKSQIAAKAVDSIDDDIEIINGVKVITRKVDIEKPSELRDLADKFKDRLDSGIIVLGADSGGKALLIAVVTKDLTKQYKAGDIIKKIAGIVGGGGGGRPDMAQAGGSKPEKLNEALKAVAALI